MSDNVLDSFGLNILAFFFGVYDENLKEQAKLMPGKFLEDKDAEQVFSDYFKELSTGITKEQIITSLNECKRLAIEKGIIQE